MTRTNGDHIFQHGKRVAPHDAHARSKHISLPPYIDIAKAHTHQKLYEGDLLATDTAQQACRLLAADLHTSPHQHSTRQPPYYARACATESTHPMTIHYNV
jgi:hypothetical protein